MYKFRRLDLNEQLVNTISSTSKHSYKQVVTYFYSLAKIVADDAIKTSKAQILRKRVQRKYPGTDIPFTLNLYSWWTTGGFASIRDSGGTAFLGVDVKFPTKKRIFIESEIADLEAWSSELIEAEIGLTDHVSDVSGAFLPLKEIAPKNLKHRL